MDPGFIQDHAFWVSLESPGIILWLMASQYDNVSVVGHVNRNDIASYLGTQQYFNRVLVTVSTS